MSAPHDDLQDVNPAQSSQAPDSAAEQAASAVDQSASAAEQDEFPQGQAPQTPVRGGPQPAVPRNPFATASLTFSLLSLGAIANMFAYIINFSLGFVFPTLVSILGIVAGHAALSDGRKTGSTRKAFTCTVLAYVAAALAIALAALLAYLFSDGLR